MKITVLLLLLTLAVCGRIAEGEVNASLENSASRLEASSSVGRRENLTQEEGEEEAQDEGRMTQEEDQDVETLEGTEGKKGEETASGEDVKDSLKERLAAALLPRPEALQGVRHGLSRQGAPQVLPGLHLGRIPPTCALCSRERNLCRIISGIFTRSPLPYGYSLVTPVPAGVCNLTITEMKPSKNYFALRRSDGTYVLNGNWDIQAEGEYQAAGTTFFYIPSDEDRGERLSSPGPLKEPIDFMLISQSPNPGIKYEYRVPLPDYLGGNPTRLGSPSSGLKPPSGGLGHGATNPNPGQVTPFQSHPQGNPNVNPRNPNNRMRNPNIGGVNPSVPVLFPYSGNTGGSIRPINPVLTPVANAGKVNYNASGVSFPPLGSQGGVGVDPAGSSPSRNPPYPGASLDPSTNTGPRNPSGISGVPGTHSHQPIAPLGSTTKTTGTLPLPWTPTYGSLPGQQYPRAPGGGIPVQRYPTQVRPDGHDSSTRNAGFAPEFPKNSVPLIPIPIPRPGGTTGGRRTTGEVSSSHSRRRPVSEEVTSATEHRTRHQHGSKSGRRKGTEKAPDFPSVLDSGVQLTQPNATVSATSGNRTVPVSIPRRRGKGGRRRHQQQQQEGVQVGVKRRRKDRRGRHRKQGSRFQWAEKGFTPCSRSCGGGNKTAILSCERRRNKKVVPDRRCSHLPRPEKRDTMCNLTPCPAAWLPEEWGPCSVTCGMGVQTRQLVCKQVVSPTLTMMVPEGACLSPPIVPTSQVCEMPRCSSTTPEWEADPWGNCSAPCGLGTRTRQVKCLVAGIPGSEEPCDVSTKPQEEQVCDMGSCATNTWFFSKWAQECSESCGTGIQTRRVHCLAGGDDFEDQCPSSSRPDASRPCRGESGCGGQWFAGPWDGCSVDCGIGRETRPVLCVVFNRERWRVTQDSHCKLEAKPQGLRECNLQPCTPEWYTSEWSQCSASCDGGIRRREITCLDVNQRQSANCMNATKPDMRQPCGLQPCGVQPSSVTPAQTATNRSLDGDTGDLGLEDDGDAVTERPEEDDTTDDKTNQEEEEDGEVSATGEEDTAQEEEEEEENELVVEETTGSALNVIPDKDAQGDESVSDDEGEEERDKKEEEEEEKKKKRKRNKDKKKRKNADRQDEGGSKASEGRKETTATVCIDRIKNCHLVFRARLCRLKYYNRVCCRTCSNT